jgi:phospholipase C
MHTATASETVSVGPKATTQKSWPVGESGNWYDFHRERAGLRARFAGRMENGKNLTRDPAMAT